MLPFRTISRLKSAIPDTHKSIMFGGLPTNRPYREPARQAELGGLRSRGALKLNSPTQSRDDLMPFNISEGTAQYHHDHNCGGQSAFFPIDPPKDDHNQQETESYEEPEQRSASEDAVGPHPTREIEREYRTVQ